MSWFPWLKPPKKVTPGKSARNIRDLHEAAIAAGWTVEYQVSKPGYPVSVAMKISRDDERAYAVWSIEGEAIRFRGGGQNHFDQGPLPRLKDVMTYVSEAPSGR